MSKHLLRLQTPPNTPQEAARAAGDPENAPNPPGYEAAPVAWLRRPGWTIEEAASLLAHLRPDRPFDLPGEQHARWDLKVREHMGALSAACGVDLPAIGLDPKRSDRRIGLVDWRGLVAWAGAKGIPIPEPMLRLAGVFPIRITADGDVRLHLFGEQSVSDERLKVLRHVYEGNGLEEADARVVYEGAPPEAEAQQPPTYTYTYTYTYGERPPYIYIELSQLSEHSVSTHDIRGLVRHSTPGLRVLLWALRRIRAERVTALNKKAITRYIEKNAPEYVSPYEVDAIDVLIRPEEEKRRRRKGDSKARGSRKTSTATTTNAGRHGAKPSRQN